MTGDGYIPRAAFFSPRHGIGRPETAAVIHAEPSLHIQGIPQTPGLLAAWLMEEEAGDRIDASPARRVLSVTGSVGAAPGLSGNAASLPGTRTRPASHYLACPNPFQGMAEHVGTLAFWIRPTDNNNQVLLAGGDEPQTERWTFFTNSASGTLYYYYVSTSSGGMASIAFGAAANGVWTHIALRWNGSRLDLFRNGAYQTNINNAFTNMRAGSLMRIGSCFNWSTFGSYFPFNGLTDEVCCWDCALTDAEIGQVYNGGAGLLITGTTGRSAVGFHRIIGTERAAYINERRLTVNAEQSAAHIANWRVIDGVATCYAASRHSVLYPKRHRLFARDVAGGVTHDLGVAEENPAAPGTFTLPDVPLPDGVYEVEARFTDALWLDARSRTVSTFRLRSGEEPTPELPAVVNLQVGLTADCWRTLSWSMGGEADDEAFAFGVWFGDESPVDISGPPTTILPRVRGLDYYQHYFRQASPWWVAVAAFAGNHRGQPAEAFLEWETARPGAPERQWAEIFVSLGANA